MRPCQRDNEGQSHLSPYVNTAGRVEALSHILVTLKGLLHYKHKLMAYDGRSKTGAVFVL